MIHLGKNGQVFDAYYLAFRLAFDVERESIKCDETLFKKISSSNDQWQGKDFYNDLKKNKYVMDDNGWALFMIEPNPYTYFFEHFSLYPFLSNNTINQFTDYIQAIYQDLGRSPADAIAYRGERIVICSRYGSMVTIVDELNEVVSRYISLVPKPFKENLRL